ncbi:MAG TPA: thymidine phosphorylase, partial [Polyangiaceae bacterium]|nr:thymidine phosphorylase [Polyangiaceae bacterium]
DGWIGAIDGLEIGLSAVAMGAGRTRADQAVDPAVGIVVRAPLGARVEPGAPLADLHVRTREQAELIQARVRAAFRVDPQAPAPKPLVIERIES